MALFPPPDNPDWYRNTEFAGQALFDFTGDIPFGDFSAMSDIMVQAGQPSPLYVGNWPALNIAASCNVANTLIGFVFQVTWLSGSSLGSTPLGEEVYYCDESCNIVDNLPVLGPYAQFTWGALHGPFPDAGNIVVGGSLQAARGTPNNPASNPPGPGGDYIDLSQTTLNAGQSKILYSGFLTPGWHWAYLEADFGAGHSGNTDVFSQLELSIDNTPQSIIAQSVPVDFRTIFQGPVFVPNIQPRIRWINTEAVNIQIQGHLLRTKV